MNRKHHKPVEVFVIETCDLCQGLGKIRCDHCPGINTCGTCFGKGRHPVPHTAYPTLVDAINAIENEVQA